MSVQSATPVGSTELLLSLFQDNQLRLWEYRDDWAGYEFDPEAGSDEPEFYWRNTRHSEDDWLGKQPVCEKTVREAVIKHLHGDLHGHGPPTEVPA